MAVEYTRPQGAVGDADLWHVIKSRDTSGRTTAECGQVFYAGEVRSDVDPDFIHGECRGSIGASGPSDRGEEASRSVGGGSEGDVERDEDVAESLGEANIVTSADLPGAPDAKSDDSSGPPEYRRDEAAIEPTGEDVARLGEEKAKQAAADDDRGTAPV